MKWVFGCLLATCLAYGQTWQGQEQILTGSTSSFSGNTHSWADVDGDGDFDLFIEDSTLWINDLSGSGNFTNASNLVPALSGGAWSTAFGDFNNDGKPDVHIAMGTSGTNALLQNNWPMAFTNVAGTYGYSDSEFCQPAFWADYNNDGLLDFYVTHEIPNEPHEFWQNQFPNNFVPRFPIGGGPDTFGLADLNSHAYGNAWADIDLDGDIDTVTSACGFGNAIPGEMPHNKVYQNLTINPGGSPSDSFADRTLDLGVVNASEVSNGSDDYWALFFDYDGDEYLDLFIGDNDGNHRLWRNTTVGNNLAFSLVNSGTHNLTGGGAFGHAAVDGDFDNDGDQDLYITTSGLHINNGDGTFTDSNLIPTSGSFRDPSWVDFNNDGFLDLMNQEDLYLNPGNSNHWLQVNLVGIPALGTPTTAHHVKLRLTANGKTQHRQHHTQVGSYSQHLLPTHFGLGSETMVDELVITWPNGMTDTLTDIPVDQRITIVQAADCTGTLSSSQNTSIRFCQGDAINLVGQSSNGVQVAWRVISGPDTSAGQFSAVNTLSTTFTPSAPGTYTVNLNYIGCFSGGLSYTFTDSDFNGNGIYDLDDILDAGSFWNTNQNLKTYDLNDDGKLNIIDLLSTCSL